MDRVIAPRWEADQRIDERYRLVRLINRGGMADVYEAVDERLERRVAVKRFRADPVADRARFDSEVTLLASLEHPNLVRVFDAGEHQGDAFLVLELVEGPTLGERLAAGAVPPHDVAVLGRDVASALAYVHERGVVHRDVSPANILCGEDGRPRLADFGVARVLDATRLTSTALTVGTAAYMAPEQVQGEDVSGAADVYSLGLILLELLTGQRAFEGSVHEVAVARLVRDPDTTGVPEAWQPLLAGMTAREPADRPTAGEAATSLDDLSRALLDDLTDLGAVAVAGATGGPAGAAAGDDAPTQLIEPVGGGTTVMPAVLAPAPEPDPEPSATSRTIGSVAAAVWQRRALLVIAGVALVILLVGLAAGGGGTYSPPSSTVPVTAETTTTTVAPTTTTSEPAPQPAPEGKGKGKGKKGGD